jgi:hypothetical protein
VSPVHRVQPTYRLAAGLPRLLAAEILPNVTDHKTFFLKEDELEKGWYVIFVQIILVCKNARKKPKSQMNFVTPTKFKKKTSGIWLQKSQSGNPGHKQETAPKAFERLSDDFDILNYKL